MNYDPDRKFDHKRAYHKHRNDRGEVSYTQDGHHFTAGFQLKGKFGGAPNVNETSIPDETDRQAVRERAAKKLADFREEASPGSIHDAFKENQRAAAAVEANVE